MNVVLCGDVGVARPIGVCLAALRNHVDDPANMQVTLLTVGWRPRDSTFVARCAGDLHLDVRDCTHNSLPRVRYGRHVTNAAYLLFLIPTELAGAKRALYLDSDLLVRKDLRPLFDLDMEGRSTAGARAGSRPFIGSPGAFPQWREMGLDPTAPTLNSGVLLMDLERWRDREIGVRSLRFAQRFGSELRWADQGALNAVLQGDWLTLPPTWNATSSVFDDDKGLYAVENPAVIDAARSDPAIVHFTGAAKPWMHGVDRPFTEEWREVARSVEWSPWEDPPTLRTRVALAKRALRRKLRRR